MTRSKARANGTPINMKEYHQLHKHIDDVPSADDETFVI